MDTSVANGIIALAMSASLSSKMPLQEITSLETNTAWPSTRVSSTTFSR